MLGPNSGSLSEKSIPDLCLDLLDLLDGLFFGEAIQEKINIGSRRELLVIELSEAAFGSAVLLGDREQAVHDRRARGNHVAPVELNERRLGEDIEVTLELLQRLNNGRRSGWATHVVGQWHDVAGLLFLALAAGVSCSDGNGRSVLVEKGEHVDMRVLERLGIGLLSKHSTEMGLVLAVWLNEFRQGSIWMLRHVLDEVCMAGWQLRERSGSHVEFRGLNRELPLLMLSLMVSAPKSS